MQITNEDKEIMESIRRLKPHPGILLMMLQEQIKDQMAILRHSLENDQKEVASDAGARVAAIYLTTEVLYSEMRGHEFFKEVIIPMLEENRKRLDEIIQKHK